MGKQKAVAATLVMLIAVSCTGSEPASGLVESEKYCSAVEQFVQIDAAVAALYDRSRSRTDPIVAEWRWRFYDIRRLSVDSDTVFDPYDLVNATRILEVSEPRPDDISVTTGEGQAANLLLASFDEDCGIPTPKLSGLVGIARMSDES